MIDGRFTTIPVEESGPAVRTQILTDTIEPTWHPPTGRYLTSRTGMIKEAKAQGLEELGNDKIEKKDHYQEIRKDLKSDLIRAYDQIHANRR